MASSTKTATIKFKRGDDFKLDFTVQDTNNTSAIANAAALATAKEELEAAQNADPQVPQDITDAQTAVSAAQAAYDASIIVDITGWTMVSQVRRAGKLIADLNTTILDAATGKFSIFKLSAETQDWPIQKLDCDVQFTRPTGVVSSETFEIDVQRDVTQ